MMDAPTDDDALLVELGQISGQSLARWEAIRTLPPDLRAAELAEFLDQDWADPTTSLGARALQLLQLLGIVGSNVSSIAGAVSGVKGI
jgi:hypothetical protein